MMNIGEYIKNLRLAKNLTQEELGKIVGVQRAAVQKWESGQVQNLKRTTIQKLADFFDVSPATFICLDEVEATAIELTTDEIKIINAYRTTPHMQEAVKKLLGIE